MTRPDIAYHMSVLCSFMHDPSTAAYDAAVHLLHYVHSTDSTQISFSGTSSAPSGISQKLSDAISSNHGLVAYSDASWHKPDKLGYNMFGYSVHLFGGPISFASKFIWVFRPQIPFWVPS